MSEIDLYQKTVSLYNELKSEEDNKPNVFDSSYIITSILEAMFFSFEVITGGIRDVLTEYEVSKTWQILLLIGTAFVVIPIISHILAIISSKIIRIRRKINLFLLRTDKEIYLNFYYYIMPICSNIDRINNVLELKTSEQRYLKSIATDLKTTLISYRRIKNMFVHDNNSPIVTKDRIFITDYDFCINTIDEIIRKL